MGESTRRKRLGNYPTLKLAEAVPVDPPNMVVHVELPTRPPSQRLAAALLTMAALGFQSSGQSYPRIPSEGFNPPVSRRRSKGRR